MRHITCPHCGDTYPDFDVAHVCSKGPYAPQLKYKMNERIKELAEQAGLTDFVLSVTGLDEELEKFAELIVRECLTVANKEHKLALEFDWDNDDTATSIKDSIKQHFGVEE